MSKEKVILDTIPEGFITRSEWAKKANVTTAALNKLKKDFNDKDMVWGRNKLGAETCYYNWETTGIPYLMNKDPETWPEWYREEMGLGALTEEGEEEAENGTKKAEEIKKLKIANDLKSLELQKARNEVLSFDEVASLLMDLAGQIKQTFMSRVAKLANPLAEAATIHEVSQILEKEFTEALSFLSEIPEYIEDNKPNKEK